MIDECGDCNGRDGVRVRDESDLAAEREVLQNTGGEPVLLERANTDTSINARCQIKSWRAP